MTPVVYYTDALIYILLIASAATLWLSKHTVLQKKIIQKILLHPRYVVSVVILMVFIVLGFLDSLHFKRESETAVVMSVFDVMLSPRNTQTEVTYSAPFATRSYVPELIKTEEGKVVEMYPRLEFSGQTLQNPVQDRFFDILKRTTAGFSLGILITLLLYWVCHARLVKWVRRSLESSGLDESQTIQKSRSAVLAFWFTLGCVLCLVSMATFLMFEYHVLGTDKVGRDVFYITLKSIRTGLVIGSLTTLIMLPFALLFGMLAGYFPGIIDDVIQYVYITLSSIPAVLLIAAAVVSLQMRIEANPDLKLLLLCIILGLTSWTSLCRYVRGETLKLREAEFVQAAVTLGANKANILWRHILPNLIHIVIITMVLDFSGLVLAEAVLTYVGVGVDPTTYSWGSMINTARLEMGRDPMVWWSLMAALIFMFTLVFAANIFSEAVQEALNPREE